MNQSEFAKVMGELAERGEPFAVATLVKTEGQSLVRAGSKVVVSGAGQVVYGTFGGACPEPAIVSSAKKAMGAGVPRTVRVYLERVEGLDAAVLKSQNEEEIHAEAAVGGTLDLYIEPFLPPQRLILVGQGGKDDVEDALVKLGRGLDFEVVVIDHSPVLSEEPDRLVSDPAFDLSKFDFSPSDSVVVLTKGERDADVLRALAKFKLRYVALVASARRAEEDRAKLKGMGVDEGFVSALRSPAGADVGAMTPAEIALSIMAEVVAVKYGKKVPGKARGPGS